MAPPPPKDAAQVNRSIIVADGWQLLSDFTYPNDAGKLERSIDMTRVRDGLEHLTLVDSGANVTFDSTLALENAQPSPPIHHALFKQADELLKARRKAHIAHLKSTLNSLIDGNLKEIIIFHQKNGSLELAVITHDDTRYVFTLTKTAGADQHTIEGLNIYDDEAALRFFLPANSAELESHREDFLALLAPLLRFHDALQNKQKDKSALAHDDSFTSAFYFYLRSENAVGVDMEKSLPALIMMRGSLEKNSRISKDASEHEAALEFTRKLFYTPELRKKYLAFRNNNFITDANLEASYRDALVTYSPGDTDAGEYVLDALNALLLRRSQGRLCLRELHFNYLNSVIQVREGRLYFRDPQQNPHNPFPLSQNDLSLLVQEKLPTLGKQVSVDGYTFYDQDGDGKIRAEKDLVQKKYLPGDTVQFSGRAKRKAPISEAVRKLSSMAPPPFDPLKFYQKGGVSFEELRQWSEQIPASTVKTIFSSPHPLEDGAYRVFIHRVSDNGTTASAWMIDAFSKLNDFDDVFVVSETWGLEQAFNAIAAKGIPISELYIGSHDDQTIKPEDVTMDYDRHLTFTPEGRAIFTGCYTDVERMYILGSEIFKGSKGTLVWSNGFNIPLLHGGIMSLGGTIYETAFAHGRPLSTKRASHQQWMDMEALDEVF